jgi:hypothetical protein
MWETFIKIAPEERGITGIRSKVRPLVSRLRDEGFTGWYHFLIHSRQSGVPTSDHDPNLYFRIRFDFEGTDPTKNLPDYCVMTRKTGRIENITGIDKSLLKNEQIEEAWRIIGEQSEWVLNMLNIHKENVDVPLNQAMQFLHYYFNMLQLAVLCPNCGKPFTP